MNKEKDEMPMPMPIQIVQKKTAEEAKVEEIEEIVEEEIVEEEIVEEIEEEIVEEEIVEEEIVEEIKEETKEEIKEEIKETKEEETEEEILNIKEKEGDIIYEKEKGVKYNIWQHIKLNSPWYFTLIVCVLIIDYYTVKNKLFSINSMILIQMWGYFTHWISHNRYFDYITGMDWHDIHHGPNSKQFHNVLIEIYVDIVSSGGIGIMVTIMLLCKLFGESLMILNYYIIVLWSFIYTSGHLINIHYLKFYTHKNHHKFNGLTNLGPDWLDILLETKPSDDIIENENSFIINAIIGTIIIVWSVNTKYDIVKFSKDLIDNLF